MNEDFDGIINRIIKLKGLASIGFADILGNGITILFWFYLAAKLDPGDYGQIQYFIGIAGTASYIALIGTPNAITVYAAKNVKIQSSLYFLSLIAGLICSFVIMIIFYRIDVSLLLFGYIINTLVLSDLLGKKLYPDYGKYVLLQKILTLVLGIGFYHLFGVNGIIYALAISYAAFTLTVYQGFRESKVDFSLLKEHLRFIMNNYFLVLTTGLAGQIDKLIIGPFLGFTMLGNYSLALQFFGGLMIFSNILYKYIVPEDSSGNSNKKLKFYSIAISIGITVIGIIILPLVIPILFPKFIGAVEVIQIISIAVIATTIDYIYVSEFLALEKSGILLIAAIISLAIMVIGMLTLGFIFSTKGIAIAFVLSAVGKAVFLIIAKKYIIKTADLI